MRLSKIAPRNKCHCHYVQWASFRLIGNGAPFAILGLDARVSNQRNQPWLIFMTAIIIALHSYSAVKALQSIVKLTSDTAPLRKLAEQLFSPPVNTAEEYLGELGREEKAVRVCRRSTEQVEERRKIGLRGHDEVVAQASHLQSGREAAFIMRARWHQSAESAETPWEEQRGGSGEWGATMP